MPLCEAGPRRLRCSENPSAEFCLNVWDDGDFPALPAQPDFINGGDEEVAVKRFLEETLPPIRRVNTGLSDVLLYLEELEIVEEICGGCWKVNVRYGTIEPPDPTVCNISFDISNDTIHVTQGKAHVNSFYGFEPGGAIVNMGVDDLVGMFDSCAPTAADIQAALDPRIQDATVIYQPPPFSGCPNTDPIYFDVTGGVVSPGGPPMQTAFNPNPFGGAINVGGGEVQGKEIKSGGLSFTITTYVNPLLVDCDFVFRLYQLRSTFNGQPFLGCFAPGEVLFCGASGTYSGEFFCITYRFEANENVVNQTIGPIPGVSALGWDCVWFYYEDRLDTVSHLLVKYPHSVHVERVYCPADFGLLGLNC